MKSKLAFFSLAIVSASLMSAAQSATPAAQSATPATKSGAWLMQQSGTTASLRGIHAVNDNVAWASGTHGTILKTTDGGANWQKCAVPPGAEKLDFRGIWAWDADRAQVLSSGPGDLSRVYETKDGCKTWTQLLINSDKDGFWDALVFEEHSFGFIDGYALGTIPSGEIIGDPINGKFEVHSNLNGSWFTDDAAPPAQPGEAAFAASNSSVIVFGNRRYLLGTGGKSGPHVITSPLLTSGRTFDSPPFIASVPMASGKDSTGIFSLAARDLNSIVAVGGDYEKPNEPSGTAAYSLDGGKTWAASATPPRGYRSAVAWFPAKQAFIAAGSNGSDYSLDLGKTWRPLDDGNWNALGLPFAVGPKGQIGKLNPAAIPAK